MSASINLSAAQMSSELVGLADMGTVTTTYTVSGFALGHGASSLVTVPIVFSSNEVISIMRINIAGGSSGISNYWFPANGGFELIDSNSAGSGTGAFTFFWQATSAPSGLTGRGLYFYVKNNTVGTTLTLPTLTLNIHTHFYAYPF